MIPIHQDAGKQVRISRLCFPEYAIILQFKTDSRRYDHAITFGRSVQDNTRSAWGHSGIEFCLFFVAGLLVAEFYITLTTRVSANKDSLCIALAPVATKQDPNVRPVRDNS